ncbi:MAG: heavy-metal-associated domain-containing protein, partial [Desulfomonile tiedjei]|nr:heavy-metal-associated domain-containing protein [Desulfomonile tiedjei]
FTVNKMNCPACVITVKEVTGKLPGVVESDVSLAAQDVIVKFREKQTNPDQIKDAIAKAGYPVKLDGLFKPDGAGINEQVIAGVNGKPVFEKDLKVPLLVDKTGTPTKDAASSFFNTIGKEILLQAADSKTIVVQPYEVEAEIQAIMASKGIASEQFVNQVVEQFGSKEKYFQVVGQRLGIRKLIDEHVVAGIQDPQEKARKTMDWLGTVFKDSDVKSLDPKFKEKIHASSGQDDWKTFWPRMISSSTELKSLLVQ